MFPVAAALQAGAGVIQGIGGAIQAHRARRDLANLKDPTTTASSEISDYYNRAAANPYNSSMYQMQQQNALRGTQSGLSALNDRHSGLAGIAGLIRAQNDASLKAGATAEQQQWSRLGDATRLKAADNQRVWNTNVAQPFQRKYSEITARAAGGNQIMNAGLQNAFGGLGMASMFGGGNSGGNNASGAGKSMQYYSGMPQTAGLGTNYLSPGNTFDNIQGQNFNY